MVFLEHAPLPQPDLLHFRTLSDNSTHPKAFAPLALLSTTCEQHFYIHLRGKYVAVTAHSGNCGTRIVDIINWQTGRRVVECLRPTILEANSYTTAAS